MWDYCVESMMVQEFMEGAVSLGDRDVVEKLGVPFTTALAELASFFAECCFVHGYMHNDLHFGNVLVRPKMEEKGAPRQRGRSAAAPRQGRQRAALAVGACYVGPSPPRCPPSRCSWASSRRSSPRSAALAPPLGAALYGFGAFVRHAKNAVTAAVGGAAGLACFFLGEHFAEVDFGGLSGT
ncbi:hypothetical protein JL720_15794 [Aureococcus anophagefferens]|nr:hypothetical protein JL720_15794 [Aureococcus anophagefferens]